MTHTPAQTAEERAKALLIYMSQLPDVPDVDATIAVFASAITQAEEAAYERAASEARASLGQWAGEPLRVEAAILALKSQKETP